MAKILYGVCGYGLGHAARAKTIADFLNEHSITLYAPFQAFDYLSKNSKTEVRKLDNGFYFQTSKSGGINWVTTLIHSSKFCLNLKKTSEELAKRIESERYDFAVSDLDPVVSRAAKLVGLPLVSVDSHSKFSFCDLPLSCKLRVAKASVNVYSRYVYDGARAKSIICTFNDYPVKSRYTEFCRIAGPVLRQSILNAKTDRKGFLLVYLRSTTKDIINALKETGIPSKVYGITKEYLTEQNIQFCPLSESFVQDMAECDAILTTAGNQLIGEAFYLKKPIMAYPEHQQVEQYLNAFLIEHSKGGIRTYYKYISKNAIMSFWNERDSFIPVLDEWNKRVVPANEIIRNEFRNPQKLI